MRDLRRAPLEAVPHAGPLAREAKRVCQPVSERLPRISEGEQLFRRQIGREGQGDVSLHGRCRDDAVEVRAPWRGSTALRALAGPLELPALVLVSAPLACAPRRVDVHDHAHVEPTASLEPVHDQARHHGTECSHALGGERVPPAPMDGQHPMQHGLPTHRAEQPSAAPGLHPPSACLAVQAHAGLRRNVKRLAILAYEDELAPGPGTGLPSFLGSPAWLGMARPTWEPCHLRKPVPGRPGHLGHCPVQLVPRAVELLPGELPREEHRGAVGLKPLEHFACRAAMGDGPAGDGPRPVPV